MSRKNKYVYITSLLVITTAIIYGYTEYNRRPADLLSVDSRISITDSSLVRMYVNDEARANELYLGKAMDVTGTISEIHNQGDTLVNVMLGKPGNLHRVSCLLNNQHLDHIKTFNHGDQVTLRGICTGYLIDVELNRCVLID